MKKYFALILVVLVFMTSCSVSDTPVPAAPSPALLPSKTAASVATPSLSPSSSASPSASPSPSLRLTNVYFPAESLTNVKKILELIRHDGQTKTVCGFAKNVTPGELIASYDALGLKPHASEFTMDYLFLSKYKSTLTYSYGPDPYEVDSNGFKSISIVLKPACRDDTEYQAIKDELINKFMDEFGSGRMSSDKHSEEYTYDVSGYDISLAFNSTDYAEKGELATVELSPQETEAYTGAPLPALFSAVYDPYDPLSLFRKPAPGTHPVCRSVSYSENNVTVDYCFEKNALNNYNYEAEFHGISYDSSIDFCESLTKGLVKLWGKPSGKQYGLFEKDFTSSWKTMKRKAMGKSGYDYTLDWPDKKLGFIRDNEGTSIDISWDYDSHNGTLRVRTY